MHVEDWLNLLDAWLWILIRSTTLAFLMSTASICFHGGKKKDLCFLFDKKRGFILKYGQK